MLDPSGDLLRLRSEHTEISRRGALPASDFANVPVHTVWDRDRTRVVLIPEVTLTDGDVLAGTYRLEWTYALDQEASLDGVSQSFHGSSEREEAAIQFVIS
jgi:hypothetical protein